jgi:hypothetical protein
VRVAVIVLPLPYGRYRSFWAYRRARTIGYAETTVNISDAAVGRCPILDANSGQGMFWRV